jgi:hypothetical protein
LVCLHQILGVPAGRLTRKGIIQPIPQHAVIQLAVAHPVAPSAARDQIGGEIHVLHATRHGYANIPQQNLLRGRDDRLGAGSADAVHGQRRRRHRQTRVDGSLSRWVHLRAGLNDVTHDHRFHLIGTKPGARNRGFDGGRTEIGCRHVPEGAGERADRSAYRLCKYD